MKRLAKLICGILMLTALVFLVGCGGIRVVFDIGDAVLISGELKQTYKDGVEIIPPEISKDGYALVGWDGDYETPAKRQKHPPSQKRAMCLPDGVQTFPP